MANIVADRWRAIPELQQKKVIRSLDSSYQAVSNIGKLDMLVSPGGAPYTTIEGLFTRSALTLLEVSSVRSVHGAIQAHAREKIEHSPEW